MIAALRQRNDARVAGLFVAASVACLLVANLALALFDADDPGHRWPDHPIIEPLSRWDTGWYFHIAEDGYFYDGPGVQSAVGFFPAYPALVRLASFIVRDTIVAAVLLSFAAGLVGFVVVHRWAADRLDDRSAWWTVGVLVTFPFAYYLFGVAYAEGLFLLTCVGAFYLLERDLTLAAGLVGAVATATRPVGVALVVGLAIRAVERRGGFRCLKWKDTLVLASGAGIAAFCAYLWWRFDDPLAYTKVKAAAGWGQDVTTRSLLKLDLFRRFDEAGATTTHLLLALQGVFTLAALALVPAVVKRFGWGYAAYSLIVIGIPFVSSTDFLAMGRYLLPAFPVFAAAGALLRDRPNAGKVLLVLNGALLLFAVNLFARWFLIS